MIIEKTGGKWISEAKWEKFMVQMINILSQASDGITIAVLESKIKQGLALASLESIPKDKGSKNKKIVPWLNEICKETVRNRRKGGRNCKLRQL